MIFDQVGIKSRAVIHCGSKFALRVAASYPRGTMPSPSFGKPINRLVNIELTTQEKPCGVNTIVSTIEVLFWRENVSMGIGDSISVFDHIFPVNTKIPARFSTVPTRFRLQGLDIESKPCGNCVLLQGLDIESKPCGN